MDGEMSSITIRLLKSEKDDFTFICNGYGMSPVESLLQYVRQTNAFHNIAITNKDYIKQQTLGNIAIKDPAFFDELVYKLNPSYKKAEEMELRSQEYIMYRATYIQLMRDPLWKEYEKRLEKNKNHPSEDLCD